MGAIGIWPLSCSCAGLLKAARLKESEITGRQMRVFKDAPARYWYVSGIVLIRNSSAAVQSEFSCHTALVPGSHRRTSNSHPNCWRSPIPNKAKLCWKASIS